MRKRDTSNRPTSAIRHSRTGRAETQSRQSRAGTSNATKTTCHECVRELAAGKWITPMRAQWRRTIGLDVEFYCYEHATPLRDADHKTAARDA